MRITFHFSWEYLLIGLSSEVKFQRLHLLLPFLRVMLAWGPRPQRCRLKLTRHRDTLPEPAPAGAAAPPAPLPLHRPAAPAPTHRPAGRPLAKSCRHCQLMIVGRPNKNFCNETCKNAFHYDKRLGREARAATVAPEPLATVAPEAPAVAPLARSCPVCQGEVTGHKARFYCSKQCQNTANGKTAPVPAVALDERALAALVKLGLSQADARRKLLLLAETQPVNVTTDELVKAALRL